MTWNRQTCKYVNTLRRYFNPIKSKQLFESKMNIILHNCKSKCKQGINGNLLMSYIRPMRDRINPGDVPNDLELYKGFSGSCQSAPTSNISEYYNNVGEYVKSTLPKHTNNDQNCQNMCVLSNNNEINLGQEQSFNGNLKAQYGYNNLTKCVPNYHVPDSRQVVSQNTLLYNVPFINQNNSNVMMYRQFYNTKKPSLKVNMKKKRRRTIFTTEQIIALEAVFQKKPYISREERIMMMHKLQVTEKSIKIWFQNRRRLTDRKDKDYVSDSPSSDDSSDTMIDRLAFIESQIQRNTDVHGYVTLNDTVMDELVNIIDEYLSQDVSSDISPMCNQTTIVKDESSRYIVMYEPISPVSLSETLDDV